MLIVSDVNSFSLSELISGIHPLSISISDTAQNFQGWGTSLAWFAEYVGGLAGDTSAVVLYDVEPRDQSQKSTCGPLMYPADWQQDIVADLLFDNDVGLGMEIVRFNVGGSNTTQDAVNSMRPFAAVPSVLLADGSYDWALVRFSGADSALPQMSTCTRDTYWKAQYKRLTEYQTWHNALCNISAGSICNRLHEHWWLRSHLSWHHCMQQLHRGMSVMCWQSWLLLHEIMVQSVARLTIFSIFLECAHTLPLSCNSNRAVCTFNWAASMPVPGDH